MVDQISSLVHRRSVKRGQHGELLARHALELYGVQQICRIETGWRIKRIPGGKIIGAIPISKVAGDFRGIMRGGRSVMVEVKERTPKNGNASGTICHSDLEPHQHTALQVHGLNGGLSIVCVVFTGHGIALMDYGIHFPVPRQPAMDMQDAMRSCLMWVKT
jgi:hypothetical protein